MSSYKQEHESFVTGHSGTSFQEIAALTSIPCLGCFARELVLLLAANGELANRNLRLLLDFLTLLVPSIIGVTLWSEYIVQICMLLAVGSALTCFVFLNRNGVNHTDVLLKANLPEKKTFVVWYRSVVNLMTALAILAVDFRVFPRRLAKSETFGFGGMDNGVGFFVIANAIVSPEARGKRSQQSTLSQLKQSIAGCAPLLLLGLGRLISVKGTDYHEHVTEYGVHWNFFFTLAALKLASALLYCLISVDKSLVVGVVVAGAHQVALSLGGLTAYVIHGVEGTGSRQGLLDANREGICSIPGYLAVYILGVALGSFLFQKRHNLKDWLDAAKLLLLAVVLCTLVMLILHSSVQQSSRRLANSTFVFWIVGNACLMVLECLLAEMAVTCVRWARQRGTKSLHQEDLSGAPSHQQSLGRPTLRSANQLGSFHHGDNRLNESCLSKRENIDTGEKVPSRKRLVEDSSQGDGVYVSSDQKNDSGSCQTLSKLEEESVCLLDAVSYNALLFFLLANVMTGVINMSMKTMYASDMCAVVVISVYLFILCYVIVALKRRNIRTKIW